MAEIKTKDVWDKLDVGAKILIPVVIAFATWYLNNSLRAREQAAQQVSQVRDRQLQKAAQDRDTRLRLFEIAIGVLQTNPKAAPEISALRSWAIGVFVDFSGKAIPENARKELVTKPLPRVVRGFEAGATEAGTTELGPPGR